MGRTIEEKIPIQLYTKREREKRERKTEMEGEREQMRRYL